MGDYFRHWLDIGRKMTAPPAIFFVNWFRTGDDGTFLWPGFGDNMRVLEWIIRRAEGNVGARQTAIGGVPELNDFTMTGLDIPRDRMEQLFAVKPADWKAEVEDTRTFYEQFGDRMPKELWAEFEALARAAK
jgi:phosphoenolpyruvate carboxykinase (GTP)